MADESGAAQQNEGTSDRFAELVTRVGGPTKVARELGASRTTVDKWASGVTRIPLGAAARVAAMAGCSLDWLAGLDPEKPVAAPLLGRGVRAAMEPVKLTEEQRAELARIGRMTGAARGRPRADPVLGEPKVLVEGSASTPPAQAPDDLIPVPVMMVSASAGPGRFTIPHDLSEGDMVAFREPWLRMMGLTPGRVHILWAVGDSMVPTIANGDMMLVDKVIDRVIDDGIYVVVVGGGVVVKRIQLRHNGSVVLKSDNQLYDEQTIPPDEVSSLVVEGRVRWCGGPI